MKFAWAGPRGEVDAVLGRAQRERVVEPDGDARPSEPMTSIRTS